MTIRVVLENTLTVPMPVEDMQLVVTSIDEDGKEEEVAYVALDEDEFRRM